MRILITAALLLISTSTLGKDDPVQIVTDAPDCPSIGTVSGATKGKRAAFGMSLSRSVAIINMLKAAKDAGATHVRIASEGPGTEINPLGGYHMTGEVYRCPTPSSDGSKPSRLRR